MPSWAKDVDKGWKEFAELLRKAKNAKVRVGLLAGTAAAEMHEGSEMTNMEIGIVQEFGAPDVGIPERSFLRAAFDQHRDEYRTMGAILMSKVLHKQVTLDRALGLIGAKAAGDIRAKVMEGAGIPPPLKPATIAARTHKFSKSFTKRVSKVARLQSAGVGWEGLALMGFRPLADTLQMINSVTWKVVAL